MMGLILGDDPWKGAGGSQISLKKILDSWVSYKTIIYYFVIMLIVHRSLIIIFVLSYDFTPSSHENYNFHVSLHIRVDQTTFSRISKMDSKF